MKQLTQHSRTGKLDVSEVPAPTTRSGGILVATQCSLISAGTEKASAQVARSSLVGKAVQRPDLVSKVITQVGKTGVIDTMKMVLNRLDAPVAPGYSCAGVVLDVGRDVNGMKVGDPVACAGQNYASHAEVVFVPRNLCVPIPAGVDFEAASYVAAGAIALQGIRQADPSLGEVVAVIGLGLLGQLTVQMLVANGCRVVGADIDASRIELARKWGAVAVRPEELGEAVAAVSDARGADAAIITASSSSSGPVTSAAQTCRKRGRVVVVGAVGMSLPREPFYVKEIDLRLSTSYGPGRYDPEYEEKGNDYPHAYVRWTEQRNMEAFLALVQSGQVRTQDLTTHRFPIERAADAYDLLLEGTEPYLGVTLQYASPNAARLARTVALRAHTPTGTVRLGIVGTGNHLTDALLPHLRRRSDVELRAICTGTGVKARALAMRLGSAYCTSDADAIFSDTSLNAVLIATRHDSHASLVVRALEAGKHVFIEKPLCLTEEELERILAVYAQAARNGQRLMVGFNRSHSGHAEQIRSALASGRNPIVMTYRVNAGPIDGNHWTQDLEVGGGRIIGEGCHFIDFMQHVSGSLVTAVQAVSISQHESRITSDHALITLEFANGSVGSLVYAAGGDRSLPKERFEAFGNGTAIVMDDFRSTEVRARGRRRVFKARKQDKGFAQEIAAFCDGIALGAPAVPIARIEAVTRACLLADRSLRTRERYPVAISLLADTNPEPT